MGNARMEDGTQVRARFGELEPETEVGWEGCTLPARPKRKHAVGRWTEDNELVCNINSTIN